MANQFLPVNRQDMLSRGWDSIDFLFVTGDAYVDHPSFAAAILSRVLESEGFKVGIAAQPQGPEDLKQFGVPSLGVLISAGNVDSMVAHYTAAKKKRSEDAYSPGGKAGLRPDRATLHYCNYARQAFGKLPVIIGGIEASLRRFAHYDYWDNRVRRSILLDSGADLLLYGMGERIIVELAHALNDGLDIRQLTFLDGTCFVTKDISFISDAVHCPSFQEVRDHKKAYAESVAIQYRQHDYINGKTLVQEHQGRYLVQNKPAAPLNRQELDRVYSLPYVRDYHPMYKKWGGVPAIAEVKFSILSSRGCFGGCNFCALAFHQGRTVQSRSHESILQEAAQIAAMPDFKGYIHDVGGPTANFRTPSCQKQLTHGICTNRQCLFPTPCKNMDVSHSDYVALLRKLRAVPGVKKVFIRSGIRYDYLMADSDDTFFYELCQHHISGQLKVAPEHISDQVLKYMGKPSVSVYQQFVKKYKAINQKLGKEQYLVPYLMSSHPGSTLQSAIDLALFLKQEHLHPQQVQDFYPTPGTVSTCMYHTGLDPRTMQPVYVAKSRQEKAMQRALLQYRDPKNYTLVKQALLQAGRQDLIGVGRNALIGSMPPGQAAMASHRNQNNRRNQGNGSTNHRRKSSRSTHQSGTERNRNKTEKRKRY